MDLWSHVATYSHIAIYAKQKHLNWVQKGEINQKQQIHLATYKYE